MKDILLIGISGGSGSGKTTFANNILKNFPYDSVGLLSMDSYYLPLPPHHHPTDIDLPNFDHPKAFDWDLLRFHLSELKAGKSIEGPLYNFYESNRTSQTHSFGPFKVVLFEGIFTLFDEQIRNLLNMKIFLQIDSDLRLARRIVRDVQERGRDLNSILDQYYQSVRPMYFKYLRPQKRYADIIIRENSEVATSFVLSKIREFLAISQCSFNFKDIDQGKG